MNSLRLVLRSVVHYRNAHVGLFIGTALAATILTGALVVGDSVDHTLRTFAMQRLGNIHMVITAGDRVFDQTLGQKLPEAIKAPVATVLALPGMAIFQDSNSGERKQVNRIQALGVDDAFWKFGADPSITLDRREAALDERLAAALGVKAGDTVALRVSKPGLLSRDAPLSSREEESSQRANFTVKTIVSDAAMGRFGLSPSQLPPSNFFVRLTDLQQLVSIESQANLLLIGEGADVASVEAGLQASFNPGFVGLHVRERGDAILQLESDRIFIDEATENAALALPGAQGALTYLVNSISNAKGSTPYSFMTASDTLTQGLANDEIVINEWLAKQLDTREGERLTVKYYEVLPSNKFEERAREFTVKRVLSMADFAAEKLLVPEFPGLSNVESCKDWKIGMPMDEELLKDPANEAYWEEFKQTPKALITLAAGREIWTNRFGHLTAVRFDRASTTPEAILNGVGSKLTARDVGFEVRSVRENAELAVSQAMDLGGLFLGMSAFLLGSAFLLTGLLYAFGAQQRAEEMGILAAVGLTAGRIRNILLAEAIVVAIPGAIVGAGTGMGYAWALMYGLANAWQDAVGRIPILFHTNVDSLVYGVLGTIVCALIAAAMTVRRLLKHSTSELLHADFTQESRLKPVGARGLWTGIISLALALGMVAYAIIFPPADVAGLFFGSGFFALIAGLFLARHFLFRDASESRAPAIPTTVTFAMLNATRRRGRSMGIISSLAAGGFLVLAVSSMQSDVTANADKRWAGTGGFALYGESTVPILNPEEIDKASTDVKALGIRLYDGDDASCLNLNHAIRPRVLGVDPKRLAELGAFMSAADSKSWELLERDYGDNVVPALVGDSDTAMWTLKKKTDPEVGDTIVYRDDAGRDVTIKLVGRLPMRLSVFQGTILVSADSFTNLWPSQEGFRVFLADAPAAIQAQAIKDLQGAFDRYGLDVTPTTKRLEMFHAVEGTYLSMFLVLGGIGLLLGASATGVVVLRNLLERRREIALLHAVGFTTNAIFRLVAYEYGLLLLAGTVVGSVASAIAMLPAMSSSHGDGSPLWRFTVFAVVLGAALACTAAALVVGLRKVSVDSLRTE